MMKTTCCLVSILSLAIGGPAAGAPVDGTGWIDDLHLRPGSPWLALPSFAGAVVGVTETRKLGSVTQRVILEGDAATIGENSIAVTITRDGLAPRIDQNDVMTEMQDAMPGLPMTVASPIGQNALGIFGYALGTRGAVTCLYGWQAVNQADRWITGEDAGPVDEHHALSIRVRLCRTGMTPPELAGIMSALSGNAGTTASWRARAVMPAEDARYDALSAAQSIDAPVLSGAAIMDRLVGPRREAHRARPRRLRQSRPAVPTRSPPAPLAGMPSVPMPQ